MLRLGTITFDKRYEPLRPPAPPPRRVKVRRRGVAGQPDYVEDWGGEAHWPLRLVSTDRTGFLTPEQVALLRALYSSGLPFDLETDLLKPHGAPPDIYAATFDTAIEPLFSPIVDGTLYQFDMLLLIN